VRLTSGVDQRDRRAPVAPDQAGVALNAEDVVDLQTKAGNAAVSRLIGREDRGGGGHAGRTVQRQITAPDAALSKAVVAGMTEDEIWARIEGLGPPPAGRSERRRWTRDGTLLNAEARERVAVLDDVTLWRRLRELRATRNAATGTAGSLDARIAVHEARVRALGGRATTPRARLHRFDSYVADLVRIGVIDTDTYAEFRTRVDSDRVGTALGAIEADPRDRQVAATGERDVRSFVGQTIAPAVDAKIAAIGNDHLIDQIDSSAGKGAMSSVRDRTEVRALFLIAMARYLPGGDADAVVGHFKATRKVRIKGVDMHMHQDAAVRVEMVARHMDRLGLPFPGASNALSLRQRFAPWDPQSRGMMSHAMGYAIDYRVYANPHIKSAMHREFRDVVVGEAGRLNLPGTARGTVANLGREMHRLAALGRANLYSDAQAAQAKGYLATFDREYERVTGASAGLQQEASSKGITDRLDALAAERQKMITDIAAARDKLRKVRRDPAGLREATAALDLLEAQHRTREQQTRQELQTLLAPWLTRMETEQRGLEARRVLWMANDAARTVIEAEERAEQARAAHTAAAAIVNQALADGGPRLATGALAAPGALRRRLNIVARVEKALKRIADTQARRADLDEVVRVLERETLAVQDLAAAVGDEERATVEQRLEHVRSERRSFADRLHHLNRTERSQLRRAGSAPGMLATLGTRFRKAHSTIAQFQPAYEIALWEATEAIATVRRTLTEEADGLRSAAQAYNTRVKRDPAAKTAVGEYWRSKRLEKLRARLVDDEEFVLGGAKHTAGDPSIRQIAKLGFFTPDPAPGATKLTTAQWLERFGSGSAAALGDATAVSLQDLASMHAREKTAGHDRDAADFTIARGVSRKEGFDQSFMRLMMMHGFHQGIAWEGSQDAMHFDFIEGLDRLVS
jgi:hypothetical protein